MPSSKANSKARSNARRLQTAAFKAQSQIEKAIPKNTKKAYWPKQKEWRTFCREQKWEDGELVTEDKLLVFLRIQEKRPLKRMNGKQRAADPTGMNILLSKVMSMLYASFGAARWQGALLALHDILVATWSRICSVHTEGIFKEVCRAFWGNLTTVPLGIRLRSLADFLMRHHMLLRGQSTRHADLADLFTLPDLKEGITPCQPLILTMGHGKMNQYGKMEYAGALRNKDPVICPLGALAIYLFWRWEFSGEPFPNFSHRAAEQGEEAARCLDQGLPAERLYYGDSGDSEEEETDDSSDSESDMEEDLSGEEESDSEAEQKRCAERRLLRKRKGAPKGYSYKTQHKWIARAFSECGIKTSAVTHTGRKAGALHMEMMGLGIESIRRHGRWNFDAMSKSYLAALDRDALRPVAAGFSERQGEYYLPRARISPPDELLPLIWPELDKWPREAFAHGRIEDMAACAFTDLLLHLRQVILQDSVELRPLFPQNPVWTHEVFQHESYARFAEQARSELHVPEDAPWEIQLKRAYPDVVEAVNRQTDTLQQGFHNIEASVNRQIESLRTSSRNQYESLRASLFPNPYMLSAAVPLQPPPLQPAVNPSTVPSAINIPPAGQPQQAVVTPQLPPPSAVPPVAPSPPLYRMNRELRTVRQLWDEWFTGSNGRPSIDQLNQEWGSRWRMDSKEINFYSRRKVIIDEIFQRTVAGNWQAAVVEVESLRKGASLDKLITVIKKIRRGFL
ncbi:Transcriptional activator of glycolytic enzymes domain containing protein [Elaphomyces granulatus]